MDESCLAHRLSDSERKQFEDLGYLVVPGVLPPDKVNRLATAAERLDAEWRPKNAHLKPHQPMNLLDAIGKDDAFLELLDLPQTFMKVVDILGWNIQIYHTHMMITPGAGQGADPGKRGWHQDSDRLNRELETDPQPRVSLKVAFFLSDCSVAGRGNFGAVPGSHLTNALVDPERRDVDPPGATVVLVPRGGMVMFDRRIWHTGTENYADFPRKALFYGYSYRWLRPRDDMRVEHYLERCDPIRRQLLGTSPSGGHGYTSPQPGDVPLRAWLERNPTDPIVAAAAGTPTS